MGYTIIRPASHDEWLRERLKGIGSSDAGTIMGASPFSTPLRLWRQRMGLDPPVKETQAMRNGHFLEPAVAEYFADATGAAIEYESEGDWMAVDDESPWLRVSPDRLFYPEGFEQTKENWCILEIKSTSKFVDPDNLPLYWLCQVQYQMGIMGIGLAAIAWITSQPRLEMGHTWVKFNPAFFETLTGAIDTFWNENVLKRIAPEPRDEKDASLLWPTSEEHKTVQATVKDIDNCRDYLLAVAEKDEAEKRVAELAAAIKISLADAEVMQTTEEETGRVITLARFKSVNETVFDEEKFKDENPDVYAQYLTQVFDKATFKDEAKNLFQKYSSKRKGSRRFSVLANG